MLPADGAFYGFIDCAKAIQYKNLKDDVDLSEQLLEQAHVALVPGESFGSPNYLRLSYATSMKNLEAAMARIQKYLTN
jgi:aspartate aminotransferase